MRQILFRGWSDERQTFVEGHFCIVVIDGIQTPCIMTGSSEIKDGVLRLQRPPVPVVADTVGQYLMKDRNGRPMFEGDIVKQHYEATTSDGITIRGHHIGTARMTTEGAQLGGLTNHDNEGNLTPEQPHKNKRIQIRSKRSEVIGNIFNHRKDIDKWKDMNTSAMTEKTSLKQWK